MDYPWNVADALYEELRTEAFNEIKRWGLDLSQESDHFVGGSLKLGDILNQVPIKLNETIRNRIFADKALVLAITGEIKVDVMSEIEVRSANEHTNLVQLMTNFVGGSEMGFAFPAVAEYCNKLATELESSRVTALTELPSLSLVERARSALPVEFRKGQTRVEKIRQWFFDNRVFSLLIVIVFVLSAAFVFIDKALDLWERVHKNNEAQIQKEPEISKEVTHNKSLQPTPKSGAAE